MPFAHRDDDRTDVRIVDPVIRGGPGGHRVLLSGVAKAPGYVVIG
jgi:hypothetical protein